MPCDILDLRCIFVNELVGTAFLTIILGAIFYFIVASKMKLGFDTTVVLSIPLILLIGLMIGGFAVLYAFISLLIAIMIGWLLTRIFI